MQRRPRGLGQIVSAVCSIAIASAGAGPTADQPQWGERFSRNMVSDEKGLPEAFDPKTGKGVKWSVDLGNQTYSTPIVAGGKVYIGTNNQQPRNPKHTADLGVLMCFDEEDGAFRWQLLVPKRDEDPYLDWPRTGIVSPVTVEGDRVYLVSNRDEVMCLDSNGMANGNDGPYKDEGRHMVRPGAPPAEVGPTDADILWVFDMDTGAGVHPHDAAHGSVLIHGDLLYVSTSNGVDGTHMAFPCPDAPSLIVVDKKTGRLVARDSELMGRRTIHSTWSSPSLAEVGGRTLVFFGGGDAVCYAFEALKEAPPAGEVASLRCAWRFDCDPASPKESIFDFQEDRKKGPSNITGMPVYHGGRIYVESGGDVWHGKREAYLHCIDAAKAVKAVAVARATDAVEAAAPAPVAASKGSLSGAVVADTGQVAIHAPRGAAEESSGARSSSGPRDITKDGHVWTYALQRHCMSTPAVRDGLAYIGDCGGTIHCIDVETGRACWTHDAKGEIWSSPLVADGKVYVGTLRGDLWVLGAGREKRLIGSAEMDSAINGTPTAANGVLYVVTMRKLYALRQSLE